MGRLGPARDQHGERVAPACRTGAHTYVCETGAFEELAQLIGREAQVPIAKPGANPGLIVRLQVHQEQPPGRTQDTDGLGDGTLGIARVVQRLRKQGHIMRAIAQW